jgi:hypothetical protein
MFKQPSNDQELDNPHFLVASQSLVLTQAMHALMQGRLALSGASSKYLQSASLLVVPWQLAPTREAA